MLRDDASRRTVLTLAVRGHAAIAATDRTAAVCALAWGVGEHTVICMRLDVLLEILRALERLAAEVAFVRLERDVNADVRGDVVALHGGRAARAPLTGEVEVVRALAPDMAFADVVLYSASCQRGAWMMLGMDFTLYLRRELLLYLFARRSLATDMSSCRW